jgi:hypothetical protein
MAQTPITDFSKLVSDAEKTVRDGAYVVLGLGILGFQQAQVRRHELAKRLSEQGSPLGATGERFAKDGRAQLLQLAKTVDGRIAPVRKQLDEQVDAIEERPGLRRGPVGEHVAQHLVEPDPGRPAGPRREPAVVAPQVGQIDGPDPIGVDLDGNVQTGQSQ